MAENGLRLCILSTEETKTQSKIDFFYFFNTKERLQIIPIWFERSKEENKKYKKTQI